MSTVTLDKLLADAMTLSPEDRAVLAARLEESLSRAIDPEILEAQLDEVERRIEAFERGELKPIDGDEFLREIESWSLPRSSAP